MARGKKNNGERKGYFYEQEEQALKDYLTTEDKEEKDRIFNKYLHPAFTKMIESIIRRYKLYVEDEEFKDTFDDTISFLMTKVNHFKPDIGYKAYSYCGTICKNHLIGKINKLNKSKKREIPFEKVAETMSDNIEYSDTKDIGTSTLLNEIIKSTSKEIEKIISQKEELKLTPNEVKVGEALVNLMNDWENIFAALGSNKFNKSSILLFLKETTLLNTKDIRNSMKKYKTAYYNVKEKIVKMYL